MPGWTGNMHGRIGKIRAHPGKRDALAGILVDGAAGMPGCLSYIVAYDPDDPEVVWVTEVWDSEASHRASLERPEVRDAIAAGRPLIAAFEDRTVTLPIGGHGLASSRA